jgi:hypothetical protein
VEWDDFSLAGAEDANPVTRGLHIGFGAPSRADVDRFWQAGTEAGFRDDGSPGPRSEYREDYYGAFLLDPDGNGAETVHHGAIRGPEHIDHSRRARTRPSTPSTARRSRPAIATTARPASARSTTPAITGPTSSIPTATTSRSSTTTARRPPA